MSSVVSTSTKHELARGGLEFPPGVVVASPHFLAVHLEVTASGYRALIFTMILEIAIAVHHVVVTTTTTTVDRFRRVHCEIRIRELILEELMQNRADRNWIGRGKIVGDIRIVKITVRQIRTTQFRIGYNLIG